MTSIMHADVPSALPNTPAPPTDLSEDPADAALALMSFFCAPRVEAPTATFGTPEESIDMDDAVDSDSEANPRLARVRSTDTTDTCNVMEGVSTIAMPAQLAMLAAKGLSSNGPKDRRQMKREHAHKLAMIQDEDEDEDDQEQQQQPEHKEVRRHWSGVARGPAPVPAGVSASEAEAERRLRMNHLRRCNEDMRILMLGWSSIEVREPGKMPHFVYEHPTLGRARSKKEIFRLHKGEKLDFSSEVAVVVSERVRQLRQELVPTAVPGVSKCPRDADGADGPGWASAAPCRACPRDADGADGPGGASAAPYRASAARAAAGSGVSRPGSSVGRGSSVASARGDDDVADERDLEDEDEDDDRVGSRAGSCAPGLTAASAAAASVSVWRGKRRACVRPTAPTVVPPSVQGRNLKQPNPQAHLPTAHLATAHLPTAHLPTPLGLVAAAVPTSTGSSRSSSAIGGRYSGSPALWRSASLDAMVAAAALAEEPLDTALSEEPLDAASAENYPSSSELSPYPPALSPPTGSASRPSSVGMFFGGRREGSQPGCSGAEADTAAAPPVLSAQLAPASADAAPRASPRAVWRASPLVAELLRPLGVEPHAPHAPVAAMALAAPSRHAAPLLAAELNEVEAAAATEAETGTGPMPGEASTQVDLSAPSATWLAPPVRPVQLLPPPPLPLSQRAHNSTLSFSRLPPVLGHGLVVGLKRAREGGIEGEADDGNLETSPQTCGKKILAASRWN